MMVPLLWWYLAATRRGGRGVGMGMGVAYFLIATLIVASLCFGLGVGFILAQFGFGWLVSVLSGFGSFATPWLVVGTLLLIDELKHRAWLRRIEAEEAARHSVWEAEQQAVRLPDKELWSLCLKVGGGDRLLSLRREEATFQIWQRVIRHHSEIVADNHRPKLEQAWDALRDLILASLAQVSREGSPGEVLPRFREFFDAARLPRLGGEGERALADEESAALTNAIHAHLYRAGGEQ